MNAQQPHWDPENIRAFGKYGPDWTAAASYASGFHSGYNWDPVKDNYVPGGPRQYFVRPHERNDADWVALCEATQENHREWMRGWHEGRAAKDPSYVPR